MKSFSKLLILFAAITCTSALGATSSWDWSNATPESEGVSAAKLESIKEVLALKKTRAFLVVRNDRIVYEWYAAGISASNLHGTASLAKALVGGMSLAVAVTDGKISLDDPAAKFIPQWKDDPRKSKILIRHLGSHTSGLSDSTTENVKHEEQPGWMGDFWKRLEPPHDPFTIARDETPMLFAPGEKFQYSNPGIGMLTYCVTAAIRDTDYKDIRALLRDRIMRRVGIADGEWSAGYGKTFVVDGLPLVGSWGGGAFTPRATARIGRLVLREGSWEGQQLLSKHAIRQVTGDAGLVGHCGMGWWNNGGQRYSGLPKDAVWGAGAGDQLLLVIPSLNLIMVRNGETLVPGPGEPSIRNDDVFTQYHDYRARILFEPLVAAVTNKSANAKADSAQAGKVIAEVCWSPKETFIRRAVGSDNWPLTWADDDAVYGGYGDGNGFEPFTNEKLSLGLARIEGGPPDFRGENIRAESLEARGNGSAARKASGLLCVKGVLYLWARNTGNSRLAWSADHGRKWTWADWKFTNSFGCPAFLNYGRNYDGNQDGYAYIYSPDGNDAYHATDQFILARVPVAHILDRSRYEFFAGTNLLRKPLWSLDLNARRAVLISPGVCYRPNVTFNAAIDRFLFVHACPNANSKDAAGRIDTRFEGGLAIYEAPQPWGPWSVVFETDRWDAGPGDSASFPAKWISADGRTLHLVFSGSDSFSVRRAQLILARDL